MRLPSLMGPGPTLHVPEAPGTSRWWFHDQPVGTVMSASSRLPESLSSSRGGKLGPENENP